MPGEARGRDTVTIVAHDVGGIGGMELQLEALIGGLLKRGIIGRCYVAHAQGWASSSSALASCAYPSRPFVLAYPLFALVASMMLLRKRAGVLHTTGAIVLNRADVCTVHYVHRGRASSAPRARRATILYRLNAAAARVLSLLGERLVYSSDSLSHTLVAVSERTADELRASYPSRSDAIAVIENGIDTKRFAPDPESRRDVRREVGVADDASLALFVGSEWLRKGLLIAVEALTEAPSWHLLVVGRGDESELAAIADRRGVSGRVHLVGESAKPERYYAGADAFVLPSEYESFSLAAFEAAASGVPVIATDVGAIDLIVRAGAGRFINRDPESVATALRELEESPVSVMGMSRAGRTVAQRLDWDAAVDKYIGIYHLQSSALAPRSPGAEVAPQ